MMRSRPFSSEPYAPPVKGIMECAGGGALKNRLFLVCALVETASGLSRVIMVVIGRFNRYECFVLQVLLTLCLVRYQYMTPSSPPILPSSRPPAIGAGIWAIAGQAGGGEGEGGSGKVRARERAG